MSKYLGYRDGGKTNEEGLYRFIAKLFKTGIPGVDSASTTLEVSQRGAGANMSVDIAIGDALIPYSTYLFTGFTDTIENVSVDAADPSNPRKDIVVAYVDLSVVDDTISNNPDAFKFKAVAGTPAGSPTFPNDAAIQASIGGSNPWVELAGIDVDAADTSVTDSMITDRREPVALMTRLWGGALNTLGHLVPNVVDDTVALLAAAQTLLNKTLTAPIINNPTISGDTGWQNLGYTPNTITPNASVPKVFDLVFNATDLRPTLSNSMKLQLARTVAAPSQCTDLEASSSQYYSKTSPNGMTFTDDFVVSAWIKLESYAASGGSTIASRFNGTSGWVLKINTNGQVSMEGYKGGGSNISYWSSYASIPLNKWVHVAGQLDMSTYTPGATDSYCMIDGVSVAILQNRAGTNPTDLTQAGNLEIGSQNGGLQPFDGKLAQVAIYSAKVTQATILASINRTLSGSETSLISAYSFNNSINDLNANANNLTANNSAVATATDSPFANGVTAGSLEYAEVLNVAFSTNTTVTVRVPDGCQIPTSGGVSSVLYSTQSNPYGLPAFSNILSSNRIQSNFSIASATPTQVSGLSCPVYVPAGATVRLTLVGNMFNSGANSNILAIWDGVVNSGTKVQASNIDFDAGSKARATSTSLLLTPTSGARTFNAGLSANAGTATLQGTTTYPANLQVELV